MAKRSFAVNTTTLPTEKITLESGYYAGQMLNPSIEGKEGKQHINIVKEQVWNKKTRSFEETNDYIIDGSIYFGVSLISKKAIKVLQQDEPKLFMGGRIRLSFDKETFTLKENHVLGAWLSALGLHDINFDEKVDWEYDEAIDIPEELQEVPNIVDMLNSVVYNRLLFTEICNSANGLDVKVKVIRKPESKNSEVMTNEIDTGNYNSFCGILPYEEGCEEDLD